VKYAVSCFDKPIYDITLLKHLLIFIRKVASDNGNPHIDLLMKLDFLSKLGVLIGVNNSEVQKEVVWIITNIAGIISTNNYVEQIIKLGIHEKIISLLSHQEVEVRNQVILNIISSAYGP